MRTTVIKSADMLLITILLDSYTVKSFLKKLTLYFPFIYWLGCDHVCRSSNNVSLTQEDGYVYWCCWPPVWVNCLICYTTSWCAASGQEVVESFVTYKQTGESEDTGFELS